MTVLRFTENISNLNVNWIYSCLYLPTFGREVTHCFKNEWLHIPLDLFLLIDTSEMKVIAKIINTTRPIGTMKRSLKWSPLSHYDLHNILQTTYQK